MKIAIVHDFAEYIGGAENVLNVLCQMFPSSDLYIPIVSKEMQHMFTRKITGTLYTSVFNRYEIFHRHPNLFKLFCYWYWPRLSLSHYDIIISSSHSFSSKAVIAGSDALHIAYIHTPPRYLYSEYSQLRIMRNPLIRFFLFPYLYFMKKLDFISAQRPTVLVAGSEVVSKRIAAYYGRSSIVINPPVFFPLKISVRKEKKYYMTLSRLVGQKGVIMAVRVCTEKNIPLVVVGIGPEESRLRIIAGPNVRFVGFVSETEKTKLFSCAKALINCAIDEDFGMSTVEALGHGVPVIAYNSGANSEIISHGKTGILFDTYSPVSLFRAIMEFELLHLSPSVCRKEAEQYSVKNFQKKVLHIISDYKKVQMRSSYVS